MPKSTRVNETQSQVKLTRSKSRNSGEGASNSAKEEILDAECETARTKSHEGCSNSQGSAQGSLESVFLTYRSNNPHFRGPSSKESKSIGTDASTSGNILDDLNGRTEFSVSSVDSTDTYSIVPSIASSISKKSDSQKSGKFSKSSDSIDGRNENFQLKKTDEITAFNFQLHEEVPRNDLQCSGKRFHSAHVYRQSNKFSSDMCVIEEADTLDSPENQHPQNVTSVPLTCYNALTDGPSMPESDPEGKTSNQHVFSENPLYNEENVNVFFVKKEKSNKRSKRKKKQEKEKKTEVTTRKLLDDEVTPEEDLEIKSQIQSICFYIVFLIFVTTIALSMVSSNMFYFADMTVSLFFDSPFSNGTSNRTDISEWVEEQPFTKSLREASTIYDFWAFAESTLIEMLYWNFYFSKMDPTAHTAKDDKKMFYENQILGVPRMRQLRVRNDSCKIHPDVERFFQDCYSYYSVYSEETRPIKNGMEGKLTASAWVYTEASKLKTTYYWGEISVYGGGGYYLDLATTKNKTKEMIKELKNNTWISRATRAIFIDFNLYNANANLFCICKIVFEFPPVGGMIVRPDFHPLKLIRYLAPFDFFVLGCEFVFVLFIIYYTYVEVITIKGQKTLFFFFWWNYIDLLLLSLAYLYIIFSVVLYIFVNNLISTLSDRYNEYTEFAFVKELQIDYNNIIGVLLFISWIKLFKFFNFNIIMLEFRQTLKRSLKDVLGFFPMFFTMFISFALLAYLLFGSQVKDYNTVWSSYLALLQAFLGEFEYKQIQEANHILGPIFYMTFIFFIFFILLNVFIAIINDAYASVKSEVISDRPKIAKYLKRGLLNFLGCSCCGLDKKLSKKSTGRKKYMYNEIKKTLRKAGFSEEEIIIFFAKYNINMNNILDEKTKRKIMEDLELKRIDFSENAEQFQIKSLRRKIDDLNQRIEELEMNMNPVIDKVDVLLRRP